MPGYARPTTVVLSTEVITQPTGDISATSLQPALAEIASEKLPVSIIDAKGDLIVGSANDTAARLPIAADGTVLAASAAASGGMAWTNSPTITTLRTTNIQHPSASVPAITLDSSGAMTGSFPYPNRNLLYNGAMQCHQRGTSTASITTAGYYTADRWNATVNALGTWTQSVENDGPSGSGLVKSLKMLCTTADAAPSANDTCIITQSIEGQDVQRVAKGTASAQQLTLSFWVKSNATGTYICDFLDHTNSRRISAAYTISASATWEKKTLLIAADTTGTITNDNAAGFTVSFWLGAGSTFTSGTLQTAWGAAVNANRAVGQTNLAASTNNYWQITGVQLETGSVATPFEFKSYGQELIECQRYFERISASGQSPFSNVSGQATSATTAFFVISGYVKKRATPTSSTISAAGTFSATNPGGGLTTATGASIINYGFNDVVISLSGLSGLTAGHATILYGVAGQTGNIDINAEL